MFNDNKDFYPTPKSVIEQMLAGVYLANKTVLEPSAGKGDIVDYLKEYGANVIACETHKDLRRIVQSKCKLLKDDFMQVTREEVSHVDYIVMNPPFSADETHILHAWEIAPDGCEIYALCNAETIENQHYRNRRKLAQTIKDFGDAQNLGNIFSAAERKTNVEVSLVRLFKPISESEFEAYYFELDESQENLKRQEGIARYDEIEAAVSSYVSAVRLYDEVADNAVRMNNILKPFNTGDITFKISLDSKEAAKADFKKSLQKSCWQWVFNKMQMDKYVTQTLKEQINRFVERQTKVPFTVKNIYRMLELIVGTHQSRMEQVLLEVFDRLTQHYRDNRYHVEGWATNSHYMVNKKFILGGVGSSYDGSPNVNNYGAKHNYLIDDFVKALCYLTGEPYEGKKTLSYWLNGDSRLHKKEWGQWYEFYFFEVRFYKKGTLHAKFRDLKVWEAYNRKVAELKGYPLPENVHKEGKAPENQEKEKEHYYLPR
jgi:hypothetical protein